MALSSTKFENGGTRFEQEADLLFRHGTDGLVEAGRFYDERALANARELARASSAAMDDSLDTSAPNLERTPEQIQAAWFTERRRRGDNIAALRKHRLGGEVVRAA